LGSGSEFHRHLGVGESATAQVQSSASRFFSFVRIRIDRLVHIPNGDGRSTRATHD